MRQRLSVPRVLKVGLGRPSGRENVAATRDGRGRDRRHSRCTSSLFLQYSASFRMAGSMTCSPSLSFAPARSGGPLAVRGERRCRISTTFAKTGASLLSVAEHGVGRSQPSRVSR